MCGARDMWVNGLATSVSDPETLLDQFIDLADASGAAGQNDLVHAIEGARRVEELERATDLLGQGLFEGDEDLGLEGRRARSPSMSFWVA